MSLDFYLVEDRPCDVFDANITHNLTKMAYAAGLYKPLWRPEELGIDYAGDLIAVLQDGISKLAKDREYFEQFNPSNGWGDYDSLLSFAEECLRACREHPNARIRVSR